MAYKKKDIDGRKNNRPPKHTQFGQSGANKPYRGGKKKKKSSTFAEDVHAAFSTTVPITMDGRKLSKTKIQIILEQVVNKAAQGDPTFIRIALSLAKSAAPTPDFEVLPEDAEVMKQFEAIFKGKEGEDKP